MCIRDSFSVAEQFTGLEGRYVKLEDTLRSFETILGGELDKYPEAAFSNVGNVDAVSYTHLIPSSRASRMSSRWWKRRAKASGS